MKAPREEFATGNWKVGHSEETGGQRAGVPWRLAGAILSSRFEEFALRGHGRVFKAGSGGARRGSRVKNAWDGSKAGLKVVVTRLAKAGDRGDAKWLRGKQDHGWHNVS